MKIPGARWYKPPTNFANASESVVKGWNSFGTACKEHRFLLLSIPPQWSSLSRPGRHQRGRVPSSLLHYYRSAATAEPRRRVLSLSVCRSYCNAPPPITVTALPPAVTILRSTRALRFLLLIPVLPLLLPLSLTRNLCYVAMLIVRNIWASHFCLHFDSEQLFITSQVVLLIDSFITSKVQLHLENAENRQHIRRGIELVKS